MFSGIIEQVGSVVSSTPRGQGRTLHIRSPLQVAPAGEAGVGTADRERIGLGDSVAVMGVCLTVEAVQPPDVFVVAAGRETLEKTTIGHLDVGDRVHLERALRMGDRLDGHLVQGHVDGVGYASSLRQEQESWVLWVEGPPALMRYIAVKGSITINGVSLTVNELAGDAFRVNVVPHTITETLLGTLRAGTPVNLEVDLLARYLERLLVAGEGGGKLSWSRLEALGYHRGGS